MFNICALIVANTSEEIIDFASNMILNTLILSKTDLEKSFFN